MLLIYADAATVVAEDNGDFAFDVDCKDHTYDDFDYDESN